MIPNKNGRIYSFDEFEFPLIRQISPTLVANDIISVQPMTATPRKLKTTWTVETHEDLMVERKPKKFLKQKIL